jgi:integrase
MGIDRKQLGLHIFRYASATAMDALNAPLSVRTARLGHGSMKTTMRYTRAISEDQRRVADALGALYNPVKKQSN